MSAPLSLAMNLDRPGPPARAIGCDGRRAPHEVLEGRGPGVGGVLGVIVLGNACVQVHVCAFASPPP